MADRVVRYRIELDLNDLNRSINEADARFNRLGQSLGGRSAGDLAKNLGVDSLTRTLAQAEQQSFGLNRQLTALSRSSSFEPISNQARRLSVDAARLGTELRTIQSALSRTTNADLIKDLERDAARAETRLRSLKHEAENVQRTNLTVRRNTPPTTGFSRAAQAADGIQDQIGSLTNSVRSLLFLDVAEPVAQFGLEAVRSLARVEDSNRLLKSSAREVGIEYLTLKERAEDFAKTLGVTNSEGARSYASIASFAKNANRADQTDAFAKGLADLAAARGIDAASIPDLTRQLNTLQDEATDKLLFANPSAFYAEYAASIGKTANSLTDAEKRAAVFDATLRKSVLFTGEAAKRLDETSGKLDRFAVAYENSKSVLGSLLVGVAKPEKPTDYVVNAASQTLNALPYALFNYGPKAIDTANDLLSFKGNTFRGLFDDPAVKIQEAGVLRERQDKAIRETIKRDALSSYNADRFKDNNFESLKLSLAAPQIREAQLKFADPTKDAAEQTKAYEEAKKRALEAAESKALAVRDDLQRSFNKSFTLNQDSSLVLRAVVKDIELRGGILDEKTKAEFIKNTEDQIKKLEQTAKERLNERISPLLAQNNVGANRQALTELNRANIKNLTGTDTDEARTRINEQFEKQSETLRKTRDDFRSFVTDTAQALDAENPFIKLNAQMQTLDETMKQRFGAFGDKFVDQATKMAHGALLAQVASARLSSQLSTLKLNQEAERLEFGQIGLSGPEQRRLDTLQARANVLTTGTDYERQAALFRELNQFSPGLITRDSGGVLPPTNDLKQLYDIYNKAPGSLAGQEAQERGQRVIGNILGDINKINALGGSNPAERSVIADSIINRINQIPPEILQNDRSGAANQLREYAARAYDSKAVFEQQKLKETIDRQRFGELTQNQLRQQLSTITDFKDPSLTNQARLKEFLAVSGSIDPSELTSDLRRGRIDALRAQADIDSAKEARAGKLLDRQEKLYDKLDALLGKNGVKIDVGEKALLEVNIKDSPNTDTRKIARPSDRDVAERYSQE